jgi:hypothetical protein
VSGVHVIEDNGESAKTSGAESVGTVEEEDQHQDPDGISNPPLPISCLFLQVERTRKGA